MAHCAGAHQRQQDVVVLLALGKKEIVYLATQKKRQKYKYILQTIYYQAVPYQAETTSSPPKNMKFFINASILMKFDIYI